MLQADLAAYACVCAFTRVRVCAHVCACVCLCACVCVRVINGLKHPFRIDTNPLDAYTLYTHQIS